MNLSERIRSCLSSPKTAADVNSIIGGDLALIRGCIQTMVKVGLLQRIGEAKPYSYQVARQLKPKLRGVEKTMAVSQAQQVRDWLKANGPAKNAEVSKGTGFPPKQCSRILSYMKRYGCASQDDDRMYHFVRDAIQMQAMTAEEKRDAQPIDNSPRQTVDEWLKAGGKIDRSPTEHKFERLSHEEIMGGAKRGFGGYQSPMNRRQGWI